MGIALSEGNSQRMYNSMPFDFTVFGKLSNLSYLSFTHYFCEPSGHLNLAVQEIKV